MAELNSEQKQKRIQLLQQKKLLLQKKSVLEEAETRRQELFSADPLAQRMVEVEEKISQRDRFSDIRERIAGNLTSPNLLRKSLGALETLAVPFASIESSIANTALGIQEGESDLKDLLSLSKEGLTLQRPGEFGDIFRVAGAPEPVASTAGFILGIGAPFKILRSTAKTFGNISKMSDKAIEGAGKNLKRATAEAEKHAGKRVDEAFAVVDDIGVDGIRFQRILSDLPDLLTKELQNKFGIDHTVVIERLTVGQLRKIKQFIGKFRPGVFSKSERGLQETINDKAINKVYSGIKKTLEESVRSGMGKRGNRAANHLLKMEENFSEVARSSAHINKAITDSVLLKPTKAGQVARGLQVEGDISTRLALRTLKRSGWKAFLEINKATKALEAFNFHQKAWNAVSRVASAVALGGAAGAAGGSLFQRTVNRE